MGRIISESEQEDTPEPLGDDSRAATMRFAAQGRNLQIALSRNREAIIDLALSVAEQYIHRSLALSPEIIHSVYDATLKAAPGLTGGTIRVHPDAPELAALEALAAGSGFVVERDPSIAPVGCILNADGIEVDSRLDIALASFRRALSRGK